MGPNSHGVDDWHGAPHDSFTLAIELLRQGKLTIEGMITHRYRLEQWREAINMAQDKTQRGD